MPEQAYYHGHGNSVMASMKAKYGDKKGERVFYATANAHPSDKPAGERPKHGSKINPHRRSD